MKIFVPVLFLFAILSSVWAQGQKDVFERTQELLQTYVSTTGLVNYSALAADPSLLNQALYDIAHQNLSGRSKEYKAAYYINAYNVLTIHNVVQNWPLKSPLDIPGFFDNIKFVVAGERMTLNEIENLKLRRDFGDPRIHFVLVCAGSGCPPLKMDAIVPDDIDERLSAIANEALNTPRMVVVDTAKKVIRVSRIFEWYIEDFGGNAAGVVSYINQFRSNALPANYSVEYLDYDWTVNGY